VLLEGERRGGEWKGWQSGIMWRKGVEVEERIEGGECYTCLRVSTVWVYAPRRRGEILQMISGEISRGINWNNGASDLRRSAKKSFSCLTIVCTVSTNDISLRENVTGSTAMHIQRNESRHFNEGCRRLSGTRQPTRNVHRRGRARG